MTQQNQNIHGLNKQIADIEAYTDKHPELMEEHHFLYNLPLSDTTNWGEYIVMGINPGVHEKDWITAPNRTQETSKYDYHKVKGSGRGNVKWTKIIKDLIPNNENIIQTELFFWSTNTTTDLEKRYGKLEQNIHLPFCTEMNRILFDHYEPKAVIFPGVTVIPIASSAYGLKHKNTVFDSNNSKEKHRLIVEYHDGKRPWIFTKHWTGGFGFSNEHKNIIKDYIGALSK